MSDELAFVYETLEAIPESSELRAPESLPIELLPDVEARRREESAEAATVLDRWRRQHGGVEGMGEDVVLDTFGAVRAYLERLLLDAGLPQAVARVECQPDNEPYIELRVARGSELARRHGETAEFPVVRIPADAVALQISRRAHVDEEWAAHLWRSVYEVLRGEPLFVHLLEGLSVESDAHGAVNVRLS